MFRFQVTTKKGKRYGQYIYTYIYIFENKRRMNAITESAEISKHYNIKQVEFRKLLVLTSL